MYSRFAAARRVSVALTVDAAFSIEPLDPRRHFSASKLSNDLTFVATDYSTRLAAAAAAAVSTTKAITGVAGAAKGSTPYALAVNQPNASIIRTQGNAVNVQAVARGSGATGLVAELKSIGATVTARYGRVISALVPVSKLTKLDGLSYLNYAAPSYAPYTDVGKAEDYGVQALHDDIATKQYGVDGTGVTVGILSDSYNDLGTAAAGVTSGDLPSAGVGVLKDLTSGGEDEGRGMAEIVHDMAPGAAIKFYTADVSEADFAAGIKALAAAGCKVIVDDVGYFDEPIFQDGIVAQAVNTVAAQGVSYFSAAGNEGRNAYQSAFVSTTATVASVSSAAGTYHNFNTSGGTSILQQITIPAGGDFTISLQWDQSYSSAGGTGSTNSVGAYLLSSTSTTSTTNLLTSAATSVVGKDPVQILSYTNTSTTASKTVYLAIKLNSGTAPGLMKYINLGQSTIATFATNSGTTYGHPVASGGQGVAAAYFGNTPAFNVNPAVQETYSSAGGTPILFSSAGVRLAAPEVRLQPAFTSVDGAATSFFGETDTDGLFHFYGTSAAAPHAAAIAALLLQAKPSLTNLQVYSTLQSTALDMGATGYDYDTGYGLIQADRALASVVSGSLSGVVYRDVNNNGVKDAGETGISGQTVFLDTDGDGVADGATTGTFAGTGTPLAITDGGTSTVSGSSVIYGNPSRVNSTRVVAGQAGKVTKITVTLSYTHTYAADLGATLISPSGLRVPLFTNIGGANGKGTGYSLVLDDAAAATLPTAVQTGVLSGTFKPQVTLSNFVGENANGIWTLETRDYYNGDTGTLNSWSMNITSAEASTTTDANGNYSFTGLKPSSTYGTYNVRATTLAGLTQTSPSSPYALSLTLGGTATANFGESAPNSTIASIVLDDGTVQRSRIRSVTLVFNGTIAAGNIGATAFTLTQTAAAQAGTISTYGVNVSSVTALSGSQTQVVLGFTGSAVVAGSLSDGRFSLLIDGSQITDSNGQRVDTAGSGVAGSTRTTSFFRLFSDIDGNGTAEFSDFLKLQAAFGSHTGDSNYVSALDANGDGAVDFSDFLQLQTRFGYSI